MHHLQGPAQTLRVHCTHAAGTPCAMQEPAQPHPSRLSRGLPSNRCQVALLQRSEGQAPLMLLSVVLSPLLPAPLLLLVVLPALLLLPLLLPPVMLPWLPAMMLVLLLMLLPLVLLFWPCACGYAWRPKAGTSSGVCGR